MTLINSRVRIAGVLKSLVWTAVKTGRPILWRRLGPVTNCPLYPSGCATIGTCVLVGFTREIPVRTSPWKHKSTTFADRTEPRRVRMGQERQRIPEMDSAISH